MTSFARGGRGQYPGPGLVEVPPRLVLSSIARGQNRDDVRNGGDSLTLAFGPTIMV